MPWWEAGGLGPPQSPVPCVAPIVLDACPSRGKCWSSGKLCGSALSPRQELISVLESSFLPLGTGKPNRRALGEPLVLLGLALRPGLGFAPEVLGRHQPKGNF